MSWIAQSIGKRDRRALSLGIAALVGILVLPRVVAAWSEWDQVSRSQASELEREERRRTSLIASVPSMRRGLQLIASNRALEDSSMLSGESTAAIAASMIAEVTEAALQTHARIGGVQVKLDSSKASENHARRSPSKALQLVGVRSTLTVSGTPQAIVDFVAWLEESPPELSIERVAISRLPLPGNNNEQILQASFVIDALARKPAAENRGVSRP